MANTKKPRSERRIGLSVSIKTRHLEDFRDICSRGGIVPSRKIEELIINFNKSILENGRTD